MAVWLLFEAQHAAMVSLEQRAGRNCSPIALRLLLCQLPACMVVTNRRRNPNDREAVGRDGKDTAWMRFERQAAWCAATWLAWMVSVPGVPMVAFILSIQRAMR